jgi:Ca-activated chloride channel family protein
MTRLLLCAALSVFAAQLPPNFATRREVVRVDVLVTDKGQPVRGLTTADFDVLDNGIAQRVDLVSFEQVPLNVVLVFDTSGSVSDERLGHMREAGSAVLKGLTTNDQAALLTFSHVVAQRAALTGRLETVRAALTFTPPEGDTALVDAMYTAMMVGESDAGRSLVIVFSDGVDTASFLPAESVLDTAKRSDVVVYGVSVGPRVRFLRDISAFTGGTVFDVDSTRNLSATFERILEEFRHRYLVSYSPERVPGGGWHRLEVRLKNRGARVQARPGYMRAGVSSRDGAGR